MQGASVIKKALYWGIFVLLLVSLQSRHAIAQTCVTPPPGLISWWPGDGTAADIIGTNHGTLMDHTTFAPGLVDQAFSLDGNGDIVWLGNNTILGSGSAPFTVAAWMFPTSNPPAKDYYFLFRLRQDFQFFLGFSRDFFGNRGDLVGAKFRGQNAQWSTPIDHSTLVNQWTHVAVTYNGGAKNVASSFAIYFNGNQLPEATVNLGSVGGRCNDNALGSDATPTCAAGNSHFYQGLIDEVQIYNRVLSTSEIQTIVDARTAGVCKDQPPPISRTGCAAMPSGLLGWWPLDETSGTAAADRIGGNDGMHIGAPTPVMGKVDGALRFDGEDDEVFVNAPFPFHQPGDATLEFWLNTPATGHQSVFWTRADNVDRDRFNIFVNGDSTFGFDYRTSRGALHTLVGRCCTGVPIPRNTWTHLAITRSGNVYSLYRDGELVATALDASPALPTATGWHMSGRGRYMYRGSLDDVALYDRALSDAEIQAIYKAGSVGKCTGEEVVLHQVTLLETVARDFTLHGGSFDLAILLEDAEDNPILRGIGPANFAFTNMTASPVSTPTMPDTDGAAHATTINIVEPQQEAPATLVLAFDSSQSMALNDPERRRVDAGKRLVALLTPDDQAAILDFAATPTPGLRVSRLLQAFTSDAALLDTAIDQVSEAGTGTPLYDALLDALDVLASHAGSNPAVVVLTNGRDSNTASTTSAVIEQAQGQATPIFPIALGDDIDFPVLQEMATQTGGLFTGTPDAEGLSLIFEQIGIGIIEGRVVLLGKILFSNPLGTPGVYEISGELITTIGGISIATPFRFTADVMAAN